MCISPFKQVQGLTTLSLRLGKVDSYFQTMRSSSLDKYHLIFSFDDNANKSYSMYCDWLEDLIFKIGQLDVEITREQMTDILLYAGYKPTTQIYLRFTAQIHSSYEDDEILSYRIDSIRRLVTIANRANELGYMDKIYVPEVLKDK